MTDYENCDVVCKANSIDGTFEFSQPLNKYTNVETDIINPSFKNTGLPHWVIEDTFEWVNSGLPSHLSQVFHANIANLGIDFETTNPGLLEESAPPYQAKFIVPHNRDWYDLIDSTIDFSIIANSIPADLSLSYANIVYYLPDRGLLLVGGQGSLLGIDINTKQISKITIDDRRELFIKDIFQFREKVYVLDENNLYEWDINSGQIIRDKGLGLPNRLYKIVIMSNSHLIIGGEDGIYARKPSQDSWQKVVDTSVPVEIVIAPDASFAVAGNNIWYSTEGFIWKKIGTVTQTINQIIKHKTRLLVATNEGLFDDNGSFYSGSVSLFLIDFMNNPALSSAISVNTAVSDGNTAVFGLSDGRYVIYDGSYSLNSEEKLPSIHRAAIVNGQYWLFGYDLFWITSETFVRRLVTGKIIK